MSEPYQLRFSRIYHAVKDCQQTAKGTVENRLFAIAKPMFDSSIEDMFSSLFVCLSVGNFAQKLTNRFA